MTMESVTGTIAPQRFRWDWASITAVILSIIGGLALTRVLYEAFFPRALWLGQPFPVLLIAIIIGRLSWPVWKKLGGDWRATAVAFPFLLNLAYLPDADVSLLRGWFFFLTSVWLAALFASHIIRPHLSRWRDGLFLIGYLAPIYLLTMGRTVGKADTFEFQVVIPRLQIAHPSGYPLYILLTKVFTFLPFGSVAWRVNLATAVYGLVAVYLLYELVKNLTQREQEPTGYSTLPAVLTAVAFGLTPTFWSQAVAAEVYTLQTLIVVTALLLMQKIGGWGLGIGHHISSSPRYLVALSLILGLGMTNHLTTVILIPPAILTFIFARKRIQQASFTIKHGLFMILAFCLPLLLYAYLPIRWQMIHGEPMGFANFIGWITGSRFQGSLQLMAWLRDTTRYTVVGRLFVAEWGMVYLWLSVLGFLFLAWRQWRFALILAMAWLGYVFYALNYYVPDLNVFLIPAFLIVGIGFGLFLALVIGQWLVVSERWQAIIQQSSFIILTIVMTPLLITAVIDTWPQVDQSGDDGLVAWGEDVLQRPLLPNAAILADSEKIAPLYYLQQAEGVRLDLDIMVLPDEATYRNELDQRIANGQAVYLARFLPGLQGIYHLRSVGPLTEVSTTPMITLPTTAVATDLTYNHLDLIGYNLEPEALTLYWQTPNPQSQISNEPLYVYLRWQDGEPFIPTGQHPANNSYPTNAFKEDEIVSDYHLLPQPISPTAQTLALQVALAPGFTPANALEWQTLTMVDVPPTQDLDLQRPLRAQVGASLLTGIDYPVQIRPQTPLPVIVSGYGDPVEIRLKNEDSRLIDAESSIVNLQSPIYYTQELETVEGNGRYNLIAPYANAQCGWLRQGIDGCVLGEIEISGVPLPDGAVNFDDKIALLNIDISTTVLQPNDQLPLTLQWQGLAPLDQDYTIFIQILDANDRIVGQIDSWPLQGTFPTSQWTPGQTVTDPYTIQLSGDLPTGDYRLIVGWYLLADLRRLPVLNEEGVPIDDKIVLPGLIAE